MLIEPFIYSQCNIYLVHGSFNYVFQINHKLENKYKTTIYLTFHFCRFNNNYQVLIYNNVHLSVISTFAFYPHGSFQFHKAMIKLIALMKKIFEIELPLNFISSRSLMIKILYNSFQIQWARWQNAMSQFLHNKLFAILRMSC